jgi:hypothetical protein
MSLGTRAVCSCRLVVLVIPSAATVGLHAYELVFVSQRADEHPFTRQGRERLADGGGGCVSSTRNFNADGMQGCSRFQEDITEWKDDALSLVFSNESACGLWLPAAQRGVPAGATIVHGRRGPLCAPTATTASCTTMSALTSHVWHTATQHTSGSVTTAAQARTLTCLLRQNSRRPSNAMRTPAADNSGSDHAK